MDDHQKEKRTRNGLKINCEKEKKNNASAVQRHLRSLFIGNQRILMNRTASAICRVLNV